MATREPSSFRDPDGYVSRDGDRILRNLTARGASTWQQAFDAGLVPSLIESSELIGHQPIEPQTDGLVLESDLVPVVTYPYEWSFTMLKEAALLTLSMAEQCFQAGFHLKDATAFNVAFNPKPIFIDIGSIGPGYPGYWPAHDQFIENFVIPLAIEAHLGIAFQPFLKAYPEGVPVAIANRLFRGRNALRKGILMNIKMRSKLQGSASSMTATDRQALTTGTQLPLTSVLTNLKKLRSLVESLESSVPSHWVDYETTHSYEDAERDAKATFVRQAAMEASGSIAWDIGANTGYFSNLLAGHFANVVAIESDPASADHMYRNSGQASNVQPVVMDFLDPTPSRGWRLQERTSLDTRAPADFSIWLAVLHHICLGRGFPLSEALPAIADVSPRSVIEFVDPTDPMSQELLASRREVPHGYSRDLFEIEIAERFHVTASTSITPTRHLYSLRRR